MVSSVARASADDGTDETALFQTVGSTSDSARRRASRTAASNDIGSTSGKSVRARDGSSTTTSLSSPLMRGRAIPWEIGVTSPIQWEERRGVRKGTFTTHRVRPRTAA